MHVLNAYIYLPPGSNHLDLAGAMESVSAARVANTFHNWFDLQRAMTARSPDVVIVNLDGLEPAQFSLIKNIQELAPGLPVLAVSQSRSGETVLSAMRAGYRQFIPWPIDPDDLADALKSIPPHTRTQSNSHCVAVIAAGGGAGATTVAANLAVELTELSKQQCAAVDMNLLLGDLGSSFDAAAEHSIADVCRNGVDLDRDMVQSAMCVVACDVAVLPRPETPREYPEITADSVEHLFHVMREIYPYIVIDLPPVFTPVTLAALGCADRVLIVTQLSVPHLRNSDRMRQYIVGLGADPAHIDFVLNRANALHEMVGQKGAEEYFKKPFFGQIPNDYRLVRSAHDLGHPLMTRVPNSPVRIAIESMARKIVAGDAAADQEAAAKKKGGVLSALLPVFSRSQKS